MAFPSLKSLLLAATIIAGTSFAAHAQVVYERGNDADPETLDPHKTSTVSEANILMDLFEGLTTYAADGSVIPGVAESWEVSDDLLTYTFHLRDDARWSNGEPVTADDFVYSFQRMLNPATAAQYAIMLYPIANAQGVNEGTMPPEMLGARAIDPSTLEVTLMAPAPYFLQMLAHQSTFPVYRPNVEEFGDTFVRPGNLISNGAYTLQSFTPNDRIVLVKNPMFHDAANVAIDQVNYYPIQDRSACMRRFEAGEIDSCSDVALEQLDYILANFPEAYREAPYLGTYYYAVDMRQPGFDDVRVRTALSMAIDREFLAEDIWANTMVPAYSLVPPGTNNYVEPPFLSFMNESILDREDMARELLAEAGFGPNNPLQVNIIHNAGENHANTATAIADMWANIGVQTTIEAQESASFYPYLQNGGEFEVARAGWIADYNDPQNFLFMLQSNNPSFNYAHYNNPEYDMLMEEAGRTPDLDARAQLLYQAEELAMRDEPFIPLMHYSSHSLVSTGLHGWDDTLQNFHPTRWMSLDE